MAGAISYRAGLAAEAIVGATYAEDGYEIVARRWRGPGGEVDLVARRPGEIVFVEVKASRSHDSAVARIGARQLARISASAESFPGRSSADDIRIDVALVDALGRTSRLENVSMEIALPL